MVTQALKTVLKPVGLYRLAIWVKRHVFNRSALAKDRADAAGYAQFIQSGDLVFDVGANCGENARVFLGLGAHVVAVEPQADCLDELTARTGSHPRLTTVQAAIAAQSGTATFYVRPTRSKSGLVDGWEEDHEAAVTVPTTTLDALIAQYGVPRFVKIDVEGFELEVLKGLHRPVPALSLEYHLRPDDIAKMIACVEYLATLGDVAINVAPAEQITMRYPAWLTLADFKDRFPADLADEYIYRYGDIYVRMR